MENEIWRPVVGYEINYEVSDVGNVRNIHTGNLLKGFIAHNGYRRIELFFNGVKKKHPVHRLVANSFIGLPPTDKHQINHKNGLKTDNRVENIEWCTGSENRKHAYSTGLSVPTFGAYREKGSDSLCARPLYIMDLNGNTIRSYGSVVDASIDLNLNRHSIARACREERKTFSGFKWKYSDKI